MLELIQRGLIPLFKFKKNIGLLRTSLYQSVTSSNHHEGGAVAQSVERATPGEEVPVSIPAVAARSLLVESVSV